MNANDIKKLDCDNRETEWVSANDQDIQQQIKQKNAGFSFFKEIKKINKRQKNQKNKKAVVFDLLRMINMKT